jgi:hypothetical protein
MQRAVDRSKEKYDQGKKKESERLTMNSCILTPDSRPFTHAR